MFTVPIKPVWAREETLTTLPYLDFFIKGNN